MLFQILMTSNRPFRVALAWLTDIIKEVEDVTSCHSAVGFIIYTACHV